MFIYAKIMTVVFLIGLTACQAKDEITIQTPSGNQAVFSVDVARTDDEQARGLMFVKQMPLDEGMIFTYATPRPSKFWMRNTLIPLDMLFFDAYGDLKHVEHSAIPLDETPRGPALSTMICTVVELNAGTAKTMNIVEGSKLMTDLTQECLQSLSE